MFKRTNKTWKALALVLALCMLSTVVVVAEEPTTATLTGVTAVYDETDNIVTVSGTIDAKGNDVTVLAVRTAAAAGENGAGGITLEHATAGAESDTGIDNEAWTTATLQNQVVYIDQAASNAETGAFSFEFIPRTAVSGGTITVFVGGADVAQPQTYSIAAPVKAPDVIARTPWYQGTNDLVMDIRKAGDASAAYGDADAITAWANKINSVRIMKTASDDWASLAKDTGYSVDAANATFTLIGVAPNHTDGSLYALEITTANGDYSKEEWTAGDAPLTQTPKAAGTLTLALEQGATAVVAGTDASITLGGDVADWNESADEHVFIGEDQVEGAAVSGTTLTVPTASVTTFEEGEATVVVSVKVPYYEVKTVNVPLITPTKAATKDATVALNYEKVGDAYDTEIPQDETEEDDDVLLNMYGFAVVTLPTPADESFTYAWSIVDPAGATETGSIANNATSVTLDRPNYVAPGSETEDTVDEYVYKLTLTVTKGDYAAATKEFTVSASRVGMKGANIEITPNFGSADIAAAATYTLTPATGGTPIVIEVAEGKFTANAVALGTYTLTIARPGYVTMEVEVTVGSTGLENFTMPTMIAGDLDGSDIVDGSDVSALGTSWGARTSDLSYQERADLNADGVVDGSDVSLLGTNWGYIKPVAN